MRSDHLFSKKLEQYEYFPFFDALHLLMLKKIDKFFKNEQQNKEKISEHNAKYMFYQQQISERDSVIQQMKTLLDVKIDTDF